MSSSLRVAELASLVGGDVIGDSDRVISGVSTLEAAAPDDLSYVESARYARQLQVTRAGAVIVPDGIDPPPRLSGFRKGAVHDARLRALEAQHPRGSDQAHDAIHSD